MHVAESNCTAVATDEHRIDVRQLCCRFQSLPVVAIIRLLGVDGIRHEPGSLSSGGNAHERCGNRSPTWVCDVDHNNTAGKDRARPRREGRNHRIDIGKDVWMVPVSVQDDRGIGGVRIEDNVLVTTGTPDVLTKAIPRDLP